MIFSLREAEYIFQHFELCGKKSTDAIIPDKSLVGRFTTNFMMKVREHYGHLQRAFFLNNAQCNKQPTFTVFAWGEGASLRMIYIVTERNAATTKG